jgi:hypothetical protein
LAVMNGCYYWCVVIDRAHPAQDAVLQLCKTLL